MARKKVVLYNPKAVFFDMPLALLSVGSALNQDQYEVLIIDGRLYPDAEKMVLEACSDALCFGVTVLTGAPLKDALNVTRKVKAKYPSLPTIWGGWHTSLFQVETLEDEPCIDITVAGQGEITFQELVDHLNANASLETVKGIAFRDAKGIITKNAARPLAAMNDLPAIDYSLIEVEQYFRKKQKRQLDYISSTGCRFRCTFCADPFVYERGWTAIEPSRMLEEFKYLKRKYQFTDINFQDETFFTNRKRIVEIAKGFIQDKIQTTWAGTMRADQAYRMSEEEFDWCKTSGLRRVLIGVESGSQQMMDWLKKDIKLEQVFLAAQRCKQRDIAVIFPFIVGFPNETEESLQSTLKVAKELKSMHEKFETPIFYFKPYPGSAITQQVVAEGYELPKTIEDWADFDYIGSSGPWVSKQKFERVEHFKFYNNLAWKNRPWWAKPIRWVARKRLEGEFFRFPIEQQIIEQFFPKQKLS